MTFILGISAYYHDSAAALIEDGEIIAAAQEERFTRKRHDERFPAQAIAYCLEEAGITAEAVDYVCFYDKPLEKFDRLLETYLAYAPDRVSFLPQGHAPVAWAEAPPAPRDSAQPSGPRSSLPGPARLPGASRVACGVGVLSLAVRRGRRSSPPTASASGTRRPGASAAETGLSSAKAFGFPHSLGLLYSAFTYFTGFKVNSGEYKLMGLAPYGEPIYADLIKEKLIQISSPTDPIGSTWTTSPIPHALRMTGERFARLFGGPPRRPEEPITQREMDLAASIQAVTEEVMLAIARSLHDKTKMKNLCLAGGVALNCVSNGDSPREGPSNGSGFSRPRGRRRLRWAERSSSGTSCSATHGVPTGGMTPRTVRCSAPASAPESIESCLTDSGTCYTRPPVGGVICSTASRT